MDRDSLVAKARQLALAMMIAIIFMFMLWGHYQLEMFS
mgnify:FL=1